MSARPLVDASAMPETNVKFGRFDADSVWKHAGPLGLRDGIALSPSVTRLLAR